jgi:hypothetical protein
VGKRVRLSFDPTVEFGGKMIGGVRLETPPGIVYEAPPASLAPSGAATLGLGTLSHSAAPGAPPAPVWDAARGAWVLPQTGPPSAAPAVSHQDTTWGGTPTLAQRINQAAPADEWVDTATGEVRSGEFNDPIPF